jgi:hypothetical protein
MQWYLRQICAGGCLQLENIKKDSNFEQKRENIYSDQKHRGITMLSRVDSRGTSEDCLCYIPTSLECI